jgi:hypothetical protein
MDIIYRIPSHPICLGFLCRFNGEFCDFKRMDRYCIYGAGRKRKRERKKIETLHK